MRVREFEERRSRLRATGFYKLSEGDYGQSGIRVETGRGFADFFVIVGLHQLFGWGGSGNQAAREERGNHEGVLNVITLGLP